MVGIIKDRRIILELSLFSIMNIFCIRILTGRLIEIDHEYIDISWMNIGIEQLIDLSND